MEQDTWLQEGFRKAYKEQEDPYFYICGGRYTSEEIQKISLQELGMRSIGSIPSKLYKYYPNSIDEDGNNYSLQALKNGTVYLQKADYFDDNFDCTLAMNEKQFLLLRIMHYANMCGINGYEDWDYIAYVKAFAEYIQYNCPNIGNVKNLFGDSESEDLEVKQHIIFAFRLENAMYKYYGDDNFWFEVFYDALHSEYEDMNKVTHRFRIACFTTSPYMINMWSGQYADNNRGFCIEYTIPTIDPQKDKLIHNLFPVIYSDDRISALDNCIKELDNKPNEEYLCALYKYGILAKSKSVWKSQDEWRLVSLDNMLAEDYNCRFYPISKVCLGEKMTADKRKEIIDICKSKGIPYVGLTRDSEKYQMTECNVLCEDCERFKNAMVKKDYISRNSVN